MSVNNLSLSKMGYALYDGFSSTSSAFSGSKTLTGLIDTKINAPQEGELLTYDDTTKNWENKGISLNDSDVTNTSSVNGAKVSDALTNLSGLDTRISTVETALATTTNQTLVDLGTITTNYTTPNDNTATVYNIPFGSASVDVGVPATVSGNEVTVTRTGVYVLSFGNVTSSGSSFSGDGHSIIFKKNGVDVHRLARASAGFTWTQVLILQAEVGDTLSIEYAGYGGAAVCTLTIRVNELSSQTISPSKLIETSSGYMLEMNIDSVTYHIPMYLPGQVPPTSTVLWTMYLEGLNGLSPLDGTASYKSVNVGDISERTLVLTYEDAPLNSYYTKVEGGASFLFNVTGSYLLTGEISLSGVQTSTFRIYINDVVTQSITLASASGTNVAADSTSTPINLQLSIQQGDSVRMTIEHTGSRNYVTGQYSSQFTYYVTGLVLSTVSI